MSLSQDISGVGRSSEEKVKAENTTELQFISPRASCQSAGSEKRDSHTPTTPSAWNRNTQKIYYLKDLG